MDRAVPFHTVAIQYERWIFMCKVFIHVTFQDGLWLCISLRFFLSLPVPLSSKHWTLVFITLIFILNNATVAFCATDVQMCNRRTERAWYQGVSPLYSTNYETSFVTLKSTMSTVLSITHYALLKTTIYSSLSLLPSLLKWYTDNCVLLRISVYCVMA